MKLKAHAWKQIVDLSINILIDYCELSESHISITRNPPADLPKMTGQLNFMRFFYWL